MKKSFRKLGWTYTSSASYRVEVSAKYSRHWFRHPSSDVMNLTDLGQFALERWQTTPEIYPWVELGAYLLSHDRIIAIVHFKARSDDHSMAHGDFSARSGDLSTVIRGFKAVVKKKAKETDPTFKWQQGFENKVLFSDEEVMAAETAIFDGEVGR